MKAKRIRGWYLEQSNNGTQATLLEIAGTALLVVAFGMLYIGALAVGG